MEQFIIQGGFPLNGTIKPGGNKNAAFPVLAACLLTEEPVIIHNVPEIEDVRTFRNLLCGLGVQVEQLEPGSYQLQAREIVSTIPDPELFGQIRGSLVLIGALLGREGRATLPAPGGDVIGRRRIDTHIQALIELGASFSTNHAMTLEADHLKGTDILLDQASVTGTENTILAAALAKGTTIIRNAASEPHIQDLCNFLSVMGAEIDGIGSNVLTIRGSDRLGGGEFTIGPDYMEVGSYIGLGAITEGEITIQDAGTRDLRMVQLVFEQLGISMQIKGNDLIVPGNQKLSITPDLGNAIPEIKDGPWPSFPPDLMSIAIVIATQSEGSVLFHEWMYESRLYFVDKLVRMGARVILCDPHRCLVQGPTQLHGEQVESPDIRAGMALLLAALCARGTSVISKISQIDRGYEQIEYRLRSLGARIDRIYDIK
ncbi:MAG: UDP-N-acetylglucosamine 1-carboxyvinyltransferase [Anaerolineales bacterium]|nr:UDP-N-acetylglucosamine 1-carboxyvinyltransferase [Anaerolineales bacterium]